MGKSDAKFLMKNRRFFWKKSEKIRYFADFSAFALHVPGSASGGENVADLSTIFSDAF